MVTLIVVEVVVAVQGDLLLIRRELSRFTRGTQPNKTQLLATTTTPAEGSGKLRAAPPAAPSLSLTAAWEPFALLPCTGAQVAVGSAAYLLSRATKGVLSQ